MGKSQCTIHIEGVLPGLHMVLHQNNPPKTQRKHWEKKRKWGEREVEIGVKVSEELIHCTIAAKLYSHPAANINKHEFSSQTFKSWGYQRSLKNNTSFLWILELQVTICNLCNYPLSRLDFLLSVFSLFFYNQSSIWNNLKIVKMNASMAIVVSSSEETPEPFLMLYSCLKGVHTLSVLMCVKTNMLYSIDLSSNMWLKRGHYY